MMNNNLREKDEIQALRPIVAYESHDNSTSLENFQNEVLRPIIKLQNDLVIPIIVAHPHFADFRALQSRAQFTKRLSTMLMQPAIKNLLIGTIVGLLTQSELTRYLEKQKDNNKRISSMLLERLVDQLY